MNILENYLNDIQLNEETEFLSEDIQSFVSKLKTLNIKKTIDSLKNAVDSKNVGKIKSIFKSIKIPNISIDKVKAHLKVKNPKFNKTFQLSKKVIQNSIPKLPEKNVDALAMAVAAKSMKSNQPMDETKNDLVQSVQQIRRYIGTGGAIDINIGTVILIVYAIAALLVGVTMGASITVLIVIGCLIAIGKAILED